MKQPITSNGRVITDDEIEAMADEAEAGYDLSQLKPRPVQADLGADLREHES
jgi:hypothetical protein